jgi:MYXO-CTERM domain-containing protein
MNRSSLSLLLLTLAALGGNTLQAAVITADSEVLAASTALAATIPASRTFTVATAGQIEVRLTDLAAPTAFTKLQLVVTNGAARVTRLDAAGTVTFQADAGTYKVQVLGTVPSRAGTFVVDVRTVVGSTSLLSFTDGISAVATASADPATTALDTTVNVVPGTYTVSLRDRSLPAALESVSVLLLPSTAAGNSVTFSGPCSAAACTRTFTVTGSGSYNLVVIGKGAATDKAGVYSVQITNASAQTVYGSTQAVGLMPQPAAITFPAAGSYTLTATDFAQPAALSTLQAAVVQGASLLGNVTSAGSATITGAGAGAAQVFAFGRVASGVNAGAGSYGLKVAQGSSVVYEDAQALPAGFDNTAVVGAYRYTGTVATGGNYAFTLRDFGFPASFLALSATVSQAGALTQSVAAAGSATVSLASGPVVVTVIGRPTSATSNSLFGITLTPAAGGTALVDRTQGVGGLYKSRTLAIPAAGSYDLTLADLQFPESFSTLAAALTQGTTLSAQLFGGGKVTLTAAAAGNYTLSVLAQPGTSNTFGVLGYDLSNTPPLPVITLSATPTAVSASGTTSLQWSTTNATSCTASGGWTGTKALSGTETSTAITADTTFTLTCSGAGGSANKSVTVTVSSTPAPATGGGGALGGLAVLGLGAAAALRRRRAA